MVEDASPLSWLLPVVTMAAGAVLWAFGARVSRHAVLAMGFASGVPCGAAAAAWLGWALLPEVVGAVLGAFTGLLLAKVGYRCMLVAIIAVAMGLVGSVLGGAAVDRGMVAAEGQALPTGSRGRAAELAEAFRRDMGDVSAERPLAEAASAMTRRFWATLDAPERTLVVAATLACAAAGLALGIFLAPLAEMAATAIVGSAMLSFGLAQTLGGSGPSAAAWAVATVTLAAAGVAVQSLGRPARPEPSAAAPPSAA